MEMKLHQEDLLPKEMRVECDQIVLDHLSVIIKDQNKVENVLKYILLLAGNPPWTKFP